ncbi:MAG: hypothetical protein R3E63_10065 [Pseudomonadales bacterium]
MLGVVVAFVIFRAASMHDALTILQAMAGLSSAADGEQVISILKHADDGRDYVLLAGLIALFAPNTQEIMSRFQPASDATPSNTRWQWRPYPLLALLTALVLSYSIVNIGQVSEFLYFQF